MPELKIAVDLAGLRMPLKKALLAASELGVRAVQIDARGEITPQLSRTGVRQLRKMLDDLRLRVSAVRFRTRRGYGTMADLDARVAATKAAMTLAHDLGAPLVVNHLGFIPSDPESEGWKLMVEVLSDLAAHGHRAGALLAAETGGADGQQLAKLLADVGDGAMAVDLNPGALMAGGFSPLEAVAALGPAIQLVHATDAHSGTSGRAGDAALLGRGDVDFPALLAALEEHGYRGHFTVGQPTFSDPTGEIAQAIEYLRAM